MIDKKTPILFVHQQKHIGGGQTYVDGLRLGFDSLGYKNELLQSKNSLSLISKIANSKSKYIIWSVYDIYIVVPYLVSFLLGKKNILLIYGIWKLESKALFSDFGNLRKIQEQNFRELKYIWKQFIFVLFCSHIIHLSEYAKSLFFSIKVFSLFKHKYNTIIYGGTDKRLFFPLSKNKKIKLRRRLGINVQDTILLMVGRIEKRKNYIDGLRVLSNLIKKDSKNNIYLYVVLSHGNFNDYKYLDAFFLEIANLNLGKRVRVISGISNDKVSAFFQAADVYLMLSKELETFGLVTLEALSTGLPVFGYNKCATPEILSKSVNRSLFDSGNFLKVSRAVTSYLIKSNSGKKDFINSLSAKKDEFNWDKSAKRIIDLINSKV